MSHKMDNPEATAHLGRSSSRRGQLRPLHSLRLCKDKFKNNNCICWSHSMMTLKTKIVVNMIRYSESTE